MKSLLIVDDDTFILEITKTILEKEGYRVHTMTSAEELFSNLKAIPDLILLDVVIPGKGGVEICRWLKSHKRTRDTPVILFSASTKIEEKALQCGADGYIAKPFEIDALKQKVSTILQHSIHQ